MIKVSELGISRAASIILITLFSGMLPITPLHAQGLGDNGYDGTTAWGDPDLQGLWTNETRTPMERPVAVRQSVCNRPALRSSFITTGTSTSSVSI